MEDEARKMSADLETKETIVPSAPALNLENITDGFMERQDEFKNVAEIDECPKSKQNFVVSQAKDKRPSLGLLVQNLPSPHVWRKEESQEESVHH